MIIGAIYRTVGKALTIFCLTFLAYAFAGRWLPGILHYTGMTFTKLVDLLIMGNNGIYGQAAGAGSGFLYWIMVFGALFSTCGGGSVLIDLGMKLGSRSKDNSGPAKAAVISSGLMGMISGSAAANVAGTGVITIPLMKSVGYEPEEAGAIESCASTGGQIMPPIMGDGAFIMAELLGISYLKICAAATLPACIYYFAIMLLVHLLARKRANLGQYKPMHVETKPILPRLYLLSPILVLMIVIGLGYTLQRAALWAILSVLVINIISPEMRNGPLYIVDQLLNATKLSSGISQPINGCGIIIGIVTISGLATRLSSVITGLGDSGLMWLGLVIAMLGCMLLGMALPTVAAYLTAYVLFYPTLRTMGISPLAANMFLFYFGIFAQITPPVCVASYTAAGIAHSSPWKTGWKAFSYALCAILAPFVFVYQPGILMEGSLITIIHDTGILATGTMFLTMGLAGYIFIPFKPWERVAMVVAGVCTCIPETISDYVGLVIAAVIIAQQIIRKIRNKSNTDAESEGNSVIG
jgi:TRAP transporter 4TM/12TM fusion protein